MNVAQVKGEDNWEESGRCGSERKTCIELEVEFSEDASRLERILAV